MLMLAKQNMMLERINVLVATMFPGAAGTNIVEQHGIFRATNMRNDAGGVDENAVPYDVLDSTGEDVDTVDSASEVDE